MDKIEKLLISGKKVFNTQDLGIIWQIAERNKLWEIIKYYLRKGKLHKVYRGVYAIDQSYSELELSQKLVPLSYISLHTALSLYGINFQYYSTIYSISLISKKYTVSKRSFFYHQIKDFIFYNQIGLITKDNYTMADKERAICDTLYLWPQMSFDKLSGLNKDKLLKTAEIYKNKRLVKDIIKLTKTIS